MGSVAESRTEHLSLHVGIIGAGIAGLSAAIALSKAGHHVEIFEKSQFSTEIGAAINVGPNAARILDRWGFDFERGRPCVAESTQIVDAKTGQITLQMPYTELKERFGYPYYLFHRVDLHNGLKSLALEQKNPDKSQSVLHLATEITKIDCGSGIITTKDGTSIHKDLLIVADGVHSKFVNLVDGEQKEPQSTGMCSYRWLISRSKLLENPLTRGLVEDTGSNMNIAYASSSKDVRLVFYPCRSGEIYNFNGVHPEKLGRNEVEDWTANGSVRDLVDTYKSFNPQLLEVCRQATDLKLWKLLFRSPLTTWVRGKAVLIGDSAHPMLPHQGQGGAQAIEDGAALGILLSNVTSLEEVPALLQTFYSLRCDRAAAIQCLSSAGYDDIGSRTQLLERYVKGRVPTTFDEVKQFIYGYDIMLEAEAAVRQRRLDVGVNA